MTDQEIREQRGVQLAAFCKIERKGDVWTVPAQSTKGRYIVSPNSEHPVCSCPDFELRGQPCKHVFAVRIVERRERDVNGDVVRTNTVTVTETIKRPTYRQQWEAYNSAQQNEKTHFQELLHDLCKGIEEPPQKMGRPRLSLRDTVFACAFKIFSTVSGRRFACDLKDAQAKGFIQDAPHYNSIFRYLESPALTPILRAMIVESALPLKAVEVDFACDSSGFTSHHYVRWLDHKYGKVKTEHTWTKAHICVGVKTNVCTAIEIEDKFAADSPLMPALVKQTAQGFAIREMSGDKGYGSLSNYAAIEQVGATPFIAFKSIHTGAGGGLWAKMFHYFNFRRDDFLKHYHKRSNVETAFHMVKSKFGGAVRSKTEVAMKNEVYCKFLCHNICCLIQEMYELGIEPSFWSKPVSA